MTIGEFSELPLMERIQKYRAMALRARKEAERASSKVARKSYALIADHWDALAVDAEKKLESGKNWLLE
jgi:hypothetical protein